MRFVQRSCLSALFLLSCSLTQAQSARSEVWIGPNDPTHGGAPDFWDMLRPDAPWQRARSRIDVFEIQQNLVTNGPPEQLRTLYAYLKENHIKLAVGIGMLTWSEQCGKHVEGYVPPGGSAYVANRIKWLGGELAYIDVDEALIFGRYYTGKNACRSTMDALVADVAENFRAYRAVFPNARLGSSEPAGPRPDKPDDNEWQRYLNAWIDGLEARTGEPMAFFHEDITNWKIPLAAYIPKLSALLRKRHIPFGIYDIASDGNGPDDGWARSVQANIRAFIALDMPEPDQLLICTWYNYPTHNLPETSPSSLTHQVNFYFDEFARREAPNSRAR